MSEADGSRPNAAAVNRYPPLVRGIPLVGMLPIIIKRNLGLFIDLKATYGDIYTLDLGVLRMVILSHPRHAAQVLRDRSQNHFRGGPMWSSLRTVFGNGLLVSEGPFWLRQRRMMQPQFHRHQLEGLFQLMLRSIDEGLPSWEPAGGGSFELGSEQLMRRLQNLVLQVLTRTLFGTALSPAQTEPIVADVEQILNHVFRGLLTTSLPAWVPVPGARRYQQTLRRLDQVMYQAIEHNRRQGGTDSLLSLLLGVVDEETRERMTDSQIRDEAVSIFMAGYDTTAVLLGWLLQRLLEDPAVLATLQAEIDAKLGSRPPTLADLQALSYARQVLQETLRLHPPIWWLPRETKEATTIDGFRIDAGTQVVLMIYALHHDPAIWEDPERFDPARFGPDRLTPSQRLAWLPFGGGHHQCIGRDYAMVEMQLLLIRMVQLYHLSPGAGRAATPRLAITLKMRDGRGLKLVRRQRD